MAEMDKRGVELLPDYVFQGRTDAKSIYVEDPDTNLVQVFTR